MTLFCKGSSPLLKILHDILPAFALFEFFHQFFVSLEVVQRVLEGLESKDVFFDDTMAYFKSCLGEKMLHAFLIIGKLRKLVCFLPLINMKGS